MSSVLDTLRESAAGYRLKRLLKKQPHQPSIYNLQTAQTAGILFDAKDPENLNVVKELINELKEHDITSQALGYIHLSKREDNYIGDNVFNFACKKDFSFFYHPKSDSIKSFMDKPFHLLIVLVNNYQFPIDYIGNLSKAKCKAGKSNIDNNLFDFMIELKDGASLKELKTNILYYLSIINHK